MHTLSNPGDEQSRATSPTTPYWLLIGLALFLWLTMPRWIFVNGDAIAMRSGTIEFLNRGTFEIPAPHAEATGEFGQYYCRNLQNQKYYSKYGIFNSLIYLPPLLVEQIQVGQLRHFEFLSPYEMLNRCFWLNLYQIALSLGLASVLYRIALLYTAHRGPAAAFVLLVFFTTFLWYYLRAQTIEIFQVLFFSLTYYHLARAHRLRRSEKRPPADQLWQAILGLTWLSLLCLEKQVYVLLFPVAVLSLLVAFYGTPRLWKQFPEWIARKVLLAPGVLLLLCLPGLLTLALIFTNNWYCCGSPFLSGYHQHERFLPMFTWQLQTGIYGFLLNPQKSVFLYFPLLVVALLGVRTFWKQNATEWSFALFAIAIYFPLNSALVFWHGDWCYGPRYLLFVFPILSLPILVLLERDNKPVWVRAASSLLLTGLILWSFVSQPLVQGVEFTAMFRARDPFIIDIRRPHINAYFEQTFWKINLDLLRHRVGRDSFIPLELARGRYPEEALAEIEKELDTIPLGNLYWFVSRPAGPKMVAK